MWFLSRLIYSVGFTLIMPLVLVKLLLRSRGNPDYRKRIPERLGLFTVEKPIEGALWIHAVSMGETVSTVPLVKAFLDKNPGVPVVFTTMTPTGSAQVKRMLGHKVFHVYLPYDIPWALNNFMRRVRPRMLMIMETEIWPNLLLRCQRDNVPVIFANARLTSRSVKGYRRFIGLMTRLLAPVGGFAAQSEQDARNFIAIGAPKDKVFCAGNLKFDISIPTEMKEVGERLRHQWGKGRPIWLAASTHEGEEEIVLQAHAIIRQNFPDALLLLVPRHPERFSKVFQLVQTQGFTVVRRSLAEPCSTDSQVFLGDTMGELLRFYAAVDIAFIGGSLVPVGGHNALEAAALSVPVIVGPHVSSCQSIVDMLTGAGAAFQVHDAQSLAAKVLALLQDEKMRAEAGESGHQVVEVNRGARDRLLSYVQTHAFGEEATAVPVSQSLIS